VKPGRTFSLKTVATDDRGDFKDKLDARSATEKNLAKLDELQEVLYAGARHAVLIVLQAMDCGGKDGTIEHIFSGINPQGCSVTSFKQPTRLELAHDFLWRHECATPPKGMIGIHNRSHYETVLVERVRKLVPKEVWRKRYDAINAFEKRLADEGTTVVKFYLHISKKEQAERLQARLDDPVKHWKFDPGDLESRKQWDDYIEAYEDALAKCSTDDAPWYVVPADVKWFRNWVVSDILVRTMRKLDLKFPPPPPGLEKIKVV
jgi:PPK2 family polyphosphate:nucleotide phosphotransferase